MRVKTIRLSLLTILILTIPGCERTGEAGWKPKLLEKNSEIVQATVTIAPADKPPRSIRGPQTSAPTASPTLENALQAAEEFRWLEEATSAEPSEFTVRFHPDGGLYVGDHVSIEVIPPKGFEAEGRTVLVKMGTEAQSRILGKVSFEVGGLDGSIRATFGMIWQPGAAESGQQTLVFEVQPENVVWSTTVFIQPRGQIPRREKNAHWATAESDCCVVYYVTGTAAERDLAALLDIIDDQAEAASKQLEIGFLKPIEVMLLPRLIGQGGFAGDGVMVSYLDRNYAGGEFDTIFHHELIHILDMRLGGNVKPALFQEGFAVYHSDGHYKPERLTARAAALLEPEPGCLPAALGSGIPVATLEPEATPSYQEREACGLDLYIPLSDLIDAFYQQQHEIAYLEGGALIAYMIQSWGEQAFNSFYRDIRLGDGKVSSETPGSSTKEAVESALRRHFSVDLAQLESGFLKSLQEVQLEAVWVEDLKLGLTLSDRGRAYQRKFDPSAYYLHAWLPDGKMMRKLGIVADILRGPSEPTNLAFESMLTSAKQAYLTGDYVKAEALLQAVTAAMHSGPGEGAQIFKPNRLATDFYVLTSIVTARNLEPQWMSVNEFGAAVWASEASPALVKLEFARREQGWIPLTSQGE